MTAPGRGIKLCVATTNLPHIGLLCLRSTDGHLIEMSRRTPPGRGGFGAAGVVAMMGGLIARIVGDLLPVRLEFWDGSALGPDGSPKPGRADRLGIAIDGRGAFRRFKDTISRWPDEQERWYRFSDERRRGRARQWLSFAGYRVAPKGLDTATDPIRWTHLEDRQPRRSRPSFCAI
jgi:Uncharacterised protein family (UPF0158)